MSESQTITEERLPNIHPGEILKEEFLDPMNISLSDLSQQIITAARQKTIPLMKSNIRIRRRRRAKL